MARTDRKELVLKALLGFGLALLAVLVTPALAQAKPGDLDRSFGDDGKVRMGFCGGYASPYSVAIDSRGRIVVGGQNTWSDGSCVDRYRSDGTLDPSFGSGGEVKTDLGAAGGVRAVAIDSQGTNRRRRIRAAERWRPRLRGRLAIRRTAPSTPRSAPMAR